MANPKHVDILKQGVEVWNKWREDNPLGPDLSGANLKGADLRGADFRLVNLWETNLRGAQLEGADFSSEFISATRVITELYYTNLSGADLSRVNFNGTLIRKVIFKEAHLHDTLFVRTYLIDAVGLETCVHHGPSILDHDTLARSPHLPREFLRGCGLTDWEIEAAKLYRPGLSNAQINDIVYKIFDLRATQAIQINPLFISYSHEDGGFIDHLEKYLNKKGIRFWRDIHHATAGRLERQVDRAIRHNPTFLLILSENSVESDWVEYEVGKARELEKELKRDVLCPVSLDDAWETASWSAVLMNQVKKYNILDFSAWKDHATFEAQFERLIRGLRIFYEEEEQRKDRGRHGPPFDTIY